MLKSIRDFLLYKFTAKKYGWVPPEGNVKYSEEVHSGYTAVQMVVDYVDFSLAFSDKSGYNKLSRDKAVGLQVLAKKISSYEPETQERDILDSIEEIYDWHYNIRPQRFWIENGSDHAAMDYIDEDIAYIGKACRVLYYLNLGEKL